MSTARTAFSLHYRILIQFLFTYRCILLKRRVSLLVISERGVPLCVHVTLFSQYITFYSTLCLSVPHFYFAPAAPRGPFSTSRAVSASSLDLVLVFPVSVPPVKATLRVFPATLVFLPQVTKPACHHLDSHLLVFTPLPVRPFVQCVPPVHHVRRVQPASSVPVRR